MRLGEAPEVVFGGPLPPAEGSDLYLVLDGYDPQSAPSTLLGAEATRGSAPVPKQTGRHEVHLVEHTPGGRVWDHWFAPVVVDSGDTADLEVTCELYASELTPGDLLLLTFGRPLQPRFGEHYAVRIDPQDAPLDPEPAVGASRLDHGLGCRLPTPESPGDYEVRLYARQPTLPDRLIQRLPFRVRVLLEAEDDPSARASLQLSLFELTLETATIPAGAELGFAFPRPLCDDQLLLRVVPAGVPNPKPVAYCKLHLGQERGQLAAPREPGHYRVLLIAGPVREEPPLILWELPLEVLPAARRR